MKIALQNVDPEKQRLKDDLNVAVIRGQKNEIIIVINLKF
jgi:hypothetical protein